MEFLDVEHQLDPHSPGGFLPVILPSPRQLIALSSMENLTIHPPYINLLCLVKRYGYAALMNVTTSTETG